MDLSIGPMLVRLRAGPVVVSGQFVGQDAPQIRSLEIKASRLDCPSGELGAGVQVEPRRIRWGAGELAGIQPIALDELGYACL